MSLLPFGRVLTASVVCPRWPDGRLGPVVGDTRVMQMIPASNWHQTGRDFNRAAWVCATVLRSLSASRAASVGSTAS